MDLQQELSFPMSNFDHIDLVGDERTLSFTEGLLNGLWALKQSGELCDVSLLVFSILWRLIFPFFSVRANRSRPIARFSLPRSSISGWCSRVGWLKRVNESYKYTGTSSLYPPKIIFSNFGVYSIFEWCSRVGWLKRVNVLSKST